EPARVLELVAIDVELGRDGLGMEAEHDRGRKRPRLGGVVAHVRNADAGLLEHLARDRVLQALARLDEAGKGRVHAGRPDALAAQEAALAPAHQHDHRRIGAGEMLGLALWVCADAHVAGRGTQRRSAAHAAEAVVAMAVENASGIGEERALAVLEQWTMAAQVSELAAERLAYAGGILEMRKIEGEMRDLPAEAEEHEMRFAIEDGARLRDGREEGCRPPRGSGVHAEEVLGAPHRHEARARIAEPLLEPACVRAQGAGAIESAGRVEIGTVHVPDPGTARAAVQSVQAL